VKKGFQIHPPSLKNNPMKTPNFAPKRKKKCKENLSKKSPKAALKKIKSVQKNSHKRPITFAPNKKMFSKKNF
jgi:hypothetical protein